MEKLDRIEEGVNRVGRQILSIDRQLREQPSPLSRQAVVEEVLRQLLGALSREAGEHGSYELCEKISKLQEMLG